MPNERLQKIRLQPGQVLQFQLPARATLTVLAGQLRIQGPHEWMAESLVSPNLLLDQHVTRHFETGGWVCLRATAGAELCLRTREARRFSDWLAGLLPRPARRSADCHR